MSTGFLRAKMEFYHSLGAPRCPVPMSLRGRGSKKISSRRDYKMKVMKWPTRACGTSGRCPMEISGERVMDERNRDGWTDHSSYPQPMLSADLALSIKLGKMTCTCLWWWQMRMIKKKKKIILPNESNMCISWKSDFSVKISPVSLYLITLNFKKYDTISFHPNLPTNSLKHINMHIQVENCLVKMENSLNLDFLVGN